MKNLFILFNQFISEDSVSSLISTISKETNSDIEIETIHLLLSTEGGCMYSGVLGYNVLKSMANGYKIRTYNMGSIKSAGIMLYVASDVRYAFLNSYFMVHEPYIEFEGNKSLNFLHAKETARSLQEDITLYKNLILENCGEGNVERIMLESVFDSHKSVELGITDEVITSIDILKGNKIVVVGSRPI